MRRRGFLGLSLGAAAVVGTAGCGRGNAARASRPWTPRQRLAVPDLLDPDASERDGQVARSYHLELHPGSTEFVAGRPTPTWGVNGQSYLGPTLRMRTGDHVTLQVENRLPEDTTVHWHGMRLPARADGGPHQLITAGDRWRTSWTVINSASTTWYHPHPHGSTAQHVFRGVAGMIIIDDDATAALPLPHTYGVDDLPCIIQDRTIGDDGQVEFDTVPTFGQLGGDIMVNGTLEAYVDVTTTAVRLRLLNASNARLYHLGCRDGRELALVANEAGLLPRTVRLSHVSLGPAERAEIVITMTPGERVVLESVGGDETIDEGTLAIMELRAAETLTTSPAVPDLLGGPGPVVAPAGAPVRRLTLQGHDAINGRGMDPMRIDQVVPAGTTEIWEIENHVYSHNFHVHGVDLSIIDKDGAAPAAYESGRKDTVHVRGKTLVRVAVEFPRFTDPTTPYMYHCHILRHEDDGMMGQFVVVEPGTEGSVPLRLAHE